MMRCVVITAALVGAAHADEVPGSAQSFVDRFYSWYALPADRGGADGNMEKAIAARPELFTARLLAALRADLAASAAEPGEIVGLDFDPFTNTQDPCERYAAGKPLPRKGGVAVPVTESCQGGSGRARALTALLVRHGESWQFANFTYEKGADLLSILRRLKAERGKKPAP